MIANLKTFVALLAFVPCLLFACGQKVNSAEQGQPNQEEVETVRKENALEQRTEIRTGAERVEEYLPLLQDKKVGMVVNQTSMIGQTHLVDSLLSLGISIRQIFAPEHGFRGEADAGEKVKDGLDEKTGIPVISLYGQKKKPLPEDLAELDLVVFDIQDVGARFYTYISAMTYLMEACAENQLPMMILDRPNPNGHYVDGPVMEEGFQSYIGMHAGVPVVHGMTVGEYAQMINGEKWLRNGIQCELSIIRCENYDHAQLYQLPVRPSPNLPNMRSIYLYPSLCFFEGTQVSVGRGTDKQFQVLGMPDYKLGEFTFIPEPKPGAKYPKHENVLCRGIDLTKIELEKLKNLDGLEISWLLEFYANHPEKIGFFLPNNFFDKLAGGETLRKQIIAGKTEKEIRDSWQPDLEVFLKIREKYLIYN